jgi:hypothetical protein
MALLAAIDFPDFKTVIGLVVAGIWVVNHIFGNRKEGADTGKPAPRAVRPPRARRADQTEIDEFLEEMLGPRTSPPPEAKPVVLRPAGPPPLAQPLPTRAEPLPSGSRGRRGQAGARRGSGEPRKPRPAQRPEQLAANMLQGVQQHMRAAESQPSAAVAGAVAGVRRPAPALSALTALLASQQDVRQAIVLAEILGPPISRRRGR